MAPHLFLGMLGMNMPMVEMGGNDETRWTDELYCNSTRARLTRNRLSVALTEYGTVLLVTLNVRSLSLQLPVPERRPFSLSPRSAQEADQPV